MLSLCNGKKAPPLANGDWIRSSALSAMWCCLLDTKTSEVNGIISKWLTHIKDFKEYRYYKKKKKRLLNFTPSGPLEMSQLVHSAMIVWAWCVNTHHYITSYKINLKETTIWPFTSKNRQKKNESMAHQMYFFPWILFAALDWFKQSCLTREMFLHDKSPLYIIFWYFNFIFDQVYAACFLSLTI